ncbi:MAG: DUF2934 domain-containing protein [Rubrivivax sp.]|nr:DUF2934 domain-containing protein [Rubrivivax sp.]MDP3082423.1 DUF2934 domain-containing protein [Rubrivivax sp.]
MPQASAPLASPKARKTTRRAAQAAPAPDRAELVRLTAYAYYEARGCIDGHDIDDWLRAEAHVDTPPATTSH